jgi:Carboxypeptidase regulatory-like domain/TonB dependent receptor
MRVFKFQTLLLFVCVLFLSTSGHGQAVYGSLFGTITDNTGAIVPNAPVSVTDENKGTTVTTQASASGEYRVDHLIPDTYTVKVTVSGFKTSETKGIQVYADTSLKVDVQLQVGGATQTVEVTAESVPLLKTDRADVATTFTQREVQDLPIGERNFTNLQLLLPGAQQLSWSHAASENPQGSKQIQVNGQAFGGVAYMLDGTDNQDPILGIIVINPPLDALSESKITTQNFDAEFGKAIASVVTAQTKSGTNKFHGSAFYYRQSNANLARDPFTQPPSSAFPDGLLNQFGGSIGGPILKDKFFFFGDYQGVRQKLGTSASMTVPSALLVSTCLGQQVGPSGIPGCDFSEYQTALGTNGIIYQTNGQPYPGNVIPLNELSPPALNLFRLLQPYKPNKAGNYNGLQNNYGGSGTGIFNSDQWDVRGDFQVNPKIHAFGRFSRFTNILTGTTLFGPAGGAGFGINNFGGNSNGANDSAAGGMDFAFNPTLIMDFRLGYYRYNIQTTKYNQNVPFANQLGIPGLNTGSFITSGAPGFNLTDVGTTGFNVNPTNVQSTGSQYGTDLNTTRCNCPLTQKEDQFQIVNNWTKMIGPHAIKIGADLRYARNLRVPSDTDRTGILSFGNGPTSNGVTGGLAFATFVLGRVTNFGRYYSVTTNAKEFQKRTFFYIQDTWRATPNLTVNYGLRYEIYFPESVNAPENGAIQNLNDGFLHVAGIGGIPSNMGWNPAPNAYNPRVGIAYQATPKTVIRAGYGRSFDIGVFGSIFGHVATQNLPVLANQTLTATGGPTSYAFSLSGGPAPASLPAVPANGLLPAPAYSGPTGVSPKARPNDLRLPTLDAWNASLQQGLTNDFSFTIAYVGNKGTHTLSAADGNSTNPNEAGITLPASLSITGQTLHYDPSVSTGIAPNGGTSNPIYLQRYYGGTLPSCQDPTYQAQLASLNQFGITPGQCGWTNALTYYGNDQDSRFDALQVTLSKRYSRGYSFTANYSWQHAYDYAAAYATWDRRAVKGRNNDLREQQLVAYGVFQLPFGRGKMVGKNVSGLMDHIIGGWELSTVVNLSSGLPFTLSYGECSTVIPSTAPCYPNGNPKNLHTSLGKFNPVAANRLYFTGTSTPLTSAPFNGFTAPGLNQIGNAGRNSLFGPSFFNADLAAQKNFPIKESLFAQFRMDAFNVFNHINAGYQGSPNVPIDQGQQFISTMTPGATPRAIRLSVRLQF